MQCPPNGVIYTHITNINDIHTKKDTIKDIQTIRDQLMITSILKKPFPFQDHAGIPMGR